MGGQGGQGGQRGQAIVLVALTVGVVVGMAALAIDGSRAYALRRDLQSAVDAAALAAADSYQQSGSYPTAEAAATAAFGMEMRLYSAPSCGPYGSPGPGAFSVSCTYSDGTVLADVVPVGGPQGSQFQLTASRTLALQFGRILTNGSTPTLSTASGSAVNNLLYSPVLGATAGSGCGGAPGTAVTVNGTGTLSVTGDLVSSGAISVSGGAARVAGDVYARCQGSVGGLTTACYPSGAATPCTFPDVAGAVRTGYGYADPAYPAPGPIGGGQSLPNQQVNLAPGVFSGLASLTTGHCYFLAGGVYEWLGGYSNSGALVSNELKPPDEPVWNNNTLRASSQFWDTGGARCSGAAQFTTASSTASGNGNGNNCNGNGRGNNCNCNNGTGNGHCTDVPQGRWSFVLTSVRTDTYNGTTYTRESAPSMCYQLTVGPSQVVDLAVSNVPGATSYNIYAAPPNNGCNGPFGLADGLAVNGAVLNTNLNPCPLVTGAGCSLGNESWILDGTDLDTPFAPNAAAAPGTSGAYPPDPERAPLAAGLPDQNPARGSAAAGDRANENSCQSTAGAYVSCPGPITPGAAVFYLPSPACISSTNAGNTYVFSGYQYDWIAVYEPGAGSPPANTCSNVIGASANSAYIGLFYAPSAAFSNISAATFEAAGTGGVIASTLSFSNGLPAITFSPAYAPVPFAARLVS